MPPLFITIQGFVMTADDAIKNLKVDEFPALGEDGKISTDVLPAVALTRVIVCGTGLDYETRFDLVGNDGEGNPLANEGDVAKETTGDDAGKSYFRNSSGDGSDEADWTLVYDADLVVEDFVLADNEVIVGGGAGGFAQKLTIGASQILARLASGNLIAATVAQIKSLLAYVLTDFLPAGAVAVATRYSVTVANCANTTDEITVATVSIAADSWADGECFYLNFYVESRQFSGGSLNLTTKIKYGASSFTLSAAVAVANNTTIGHNLVTVALYRKGADIIVPAQLAFPITSMSLAFLQLSTDAFSGRKILAPGFDTAKDITLTIQWSGASANTYFNVLHGTFTRV